MPETWTITPTAENQRAFDSLLSSIGESVCQVHPYEQRGAARGTFDIIVEGKTDDERAHIRQKLERLGLRCMSDQERTMLAQEILLPRQTPSLPESSFKPAPSDVPLDDDAIQRLEGEGGIVRE